MLKVFNDYESLLLFLFNQKYSKNSNIVTLLQIKIHVFFNIF